MFKQKYLTTYASWLGKLIGIRLGAPVESWSHEEIINVYGKVKGYLVDYGTFASDDDANGPLFFVRSLIDNCSKEITTEELSHGLLGYVPDGHSFFWWGGIGVSTEDTSYHNLLNGIKAPQSGSAAQNTKGLSEQIGGQIFSDCWGYVSLGNVDLAVDLAAKMSSVTHDGQAIEGGKFVAACIALAYEVKDCKEIITKALTYLNDGEYQDCVLDIMHHHTIEDEDTCLEYILEHYAYKHYPGVCHIIPNTAIMIWAMLYGNNDFDKTLCMLCEAGWDTDCTCGNVGSIMGAMVGLNNIDVKWIEPWKDVLLSSSAIGGYNIDTISNTARLYTLLGAKLNNIEIPEWFTYTIEKPDYMFDLPYGTQGFKVTSNRYHESRVYTKDNKLVVGVGSLYPNTSLKVYKQFYYNPNDVYDCRYQPDFISLLNNGNTITYTIKSSIPVWAKEYVVDSKGTIFYGKNFELNESFERHSLTLDFDCVGYYKEFGLIISNEERQGRFTIEFDNFSIDHKLDLMLDFESMTMENWGINFDGTVWKTIPDCTTFRANAYLDNGLHIKNDGIIMSDPYSKLKSFSLEGYFEEKFEIRFNLKSLEKYNCIQLTDDVIDVYSVENGKTKNIKKISLKCLKNTNIQLNISVKNGLINMYINGVDISFEVPFNINQIGSVGLFALDNASALIKNCHIVCD